jgi:manganese efflux pump family protein
VGELLLRRPPADRASAGPPLITLLALILPLGLDSFAVAAALGAAGLPERRRWRVSLLIAAVEAAMPLVGLALGAPLGRAIGDAADYVGVAVLIGFGLFTLLHDDETEAAAMLAPVHGPAALLLGLSVSLDELAIGFTLGLLDVPLLPVIAAIALQALVLSQVGLRLGARVSRRWSEHAERVAGIALILVGGVLLVETLVGG